MSSQLVSSYLINSVYEKCLIVKLMMFEMIIIRFQLVSNILVVFSNLFEIKFNINLKLLNFNLSIYNDCSRSSTLSKRQIL